MLYFRYGLSFPIRKSPYTNWKSKSKKISLVQVVRDKTFVQHRIKRNSRTCPALAIATSFILTVKVVVPSGNFRGHDVVLNRVDDPKKPVDRNLFNMFGNAQVAGMVCPRPLMIQMGAEDTLFDLEGVRREAKKAAVYYQKLGVGDLFEYSEHSGGHVFENESIFQFFKKHL